MARQASPPDVQNLQGMGEVEARLIQKRVAESGADHGPQRHVSEEPVDLGSRQAVALEDSPAHLVRGQQAHREENTIPSDGERTQMNQDRVHVPHHPSVQRRSHRRH